MRIGILTGGGDVPGLNPCIKAVATSAAELGWETIGFRRGWAGPLNIDPDDPELLNLAGWARLRAGKDLSEAVRLLGRARDADPGNAEYAANLATAKAAAG